MSGTSIAYLISHQKILIIENFGEINKRKFYTIGLSVYSKDIKSAKISDFCLFSHQEFLISLTFEGVISVYNYKVNSFPITQRLIEMTGTAYSIAANFNLKYTDLRVKEFGNEIQDEGEMVECDFNRYDLVIVVTTHDPFLGSAVFPYL